MRVSACGIILAALILACAPAGAAVYSLSFTKLTGETGGFPAETAVYRADVSGIPLSTIEYITILDNSMGTGGTTGKFSGFDLDAIKLADVSYGTAASVKTATGLSVFDITPAGTTFAPGTQRPPTDPFLFGSNALGVDNAVATLGDFDANSTTGILANGFVSMGDAGKLTFKLTNPVSTTSLFLYIGEVGDNGEVAASSITVGNTPDPVIPELPAGLLAALGACCGFGLRRLRKSR